MRRLALVPAALLASAAVAVAAAGCGGPSRGASDPAATGTTAGAPSPARPRRDPPGRTTAGRERTPRAGGRRASAFGPLRPGRVPRPLSRHDVYAAGRPRRLNAVTRRARRLVYVPNSASDTVDVISQRTYRVVRQLHTGALPQHVTPSWDLRTLWVDNDGGNSLTP